MGGGGGGGEENQHGTSMVGFKSQQLLNKILADMAVTIWPGMKEGSSAVLFLNAAWQLPQHYD